MFGKKLDNGLDRTVTGLKQFAAVVSPVEPVRVPFDTRRFFFVVTLAAVSG
jgi:hypothetical protein